MLFFNKSFLRENLAVRDFFVTISSENLMGKRKKINIRGRKMRLRSTRKFPNLIPLYTGEWMFSLV
jgi:hypothetical protein